MPTIPVNDDGAVLYYEDSGAPGDAPYYPTVFVLHGFIYHGGELLTIVQAPVLCLKESLPSYIPSIDPLRLVSQHPHRCY